jgi:Protein of unknown function (DUF2794)
LVQPGYRGNEGKLAKQNVEGWSELRQKQGISSWRPNISDLPKYPKHVILHFDWRGNTPLSSADSVDQFADERSSATLLRFPHRATPRVSFDRKELSLILGLYGRHVAEGEWRDYALDFGRDCATFSIFRRSSEQPLYRVVKNPAHQRKQGAYAVITQTGLILKRGHDLAQVLAVLLRKPHLA